MRFDRSREQWYNAAQSHRPFQTSFPLSVAAAYLATANEETYMHPFWMRFGRIGS